MTVRIYGEQVHPTQCPVCTNGLVALSRVGRDPQGFAGMTRWVASRLSAVIPCPQCSSASGLLQVLSPYGGDAS